jgi:hypothetical protein
VQQKARPKPLNLYNWRGIAKELSWNKERELKTDIFKK